jgi:hypothetical protein
MDEELKAMLEGAKAQGANDTDLGKIIDMYEADASKKKASSNWGSDSQPKDTATSLASGDWTKSTTPSEKPIEKLKTKLQKPPVKEDTSFFDYLKENLDTGLATVSKSLYDAPSLVYDAAASITNPIIKGLTGYDGEGASSDKLANDLGFKNIPSDILKEKIKVSNEKINAYSAKNGGDALQAVQDGDYVNAAKLVAGTTMQSLPIMVAAMASGGQTSALVAIGASTASTKNAQLKDENPEMRLGTRVLNATNAGIIEAVTGHLFTGASGAVMKKILADKGVEAGSKIIGKSFRSTVEKAIEKNPLVGAVGEVIEESAVEFGNQLNDMSSGIRTEFDVHAIKNAGLSATGMGGLQTLGVYGAKGYVKAKDYAKLKATNKEVFKLRSEINNGNLSDENKAVLGLRADRLEAENKKLLGTEIEKAKALPTEQKSELNALNNEFEDLKTKFDNIDDAEDIPTNLKPALKEEIKLQASKNQKRKTEILSQNDGLEVKDDFSKFDGVEPDFDLENGKISSLPLKEQDRLNKLAIEKITNGDKTIEYSKEQVSKTANEIYKNEQTPQTTEAQPQAEAEKVAEVSPVEDVVAPSVEEVKPISQLGSGANVYFESEKYRVNDDSKNGKILLNIGDAKGEIPLANIEFDNPKEAVFVAEKLQENAPEGLVSNYHNIDNIIKGYKEEYAGKENGDNPTNGNISIDPTNVGESGITEQESPAKEGVSKPVDGGEVKGDAEVSNLDYAKSQIEKGILNWDSNILTPRIDLGLSWADIRKGEADIKRGKENSVPAKRLIEAIAKAKEEGGYHYKQGTGGESQRAKLFVSLDDVQRANNEYQLTDAEQKEVNTNEAELIKRHEEHFDSLDKETQTEILENYENRQKEVDNKGEIPTDSKIGESKNDVPNGQIGEKPTTKERIAERIKLSDAKVDAKADVVKSKLKAFADMFPSADINPDDYDLNGFSMDAIIDMVAKAAKAIAKGGIVTSEHIKEAIAAYNTHFDDEIDPKAVEERINPKKEESKSTDSRREKNSSEKASDLGINEKQYLDLGDKIKKIPQTGVFENYLSGKTIEREYANPTNDQSYDAVTLKDIAQHGEDIVNQAKELFEDTYVEKTLDYLQSANLNSFEKGVVFAVLENLMDTKVKSDPKNKSLLKLQELVYADSQANLRSASLGINTGRLRSVYNAIKNGIDVDKIASQAYTDKQKEAKLIIEGAVPNGENLNKASDVNENSVVDADLEALISEGVDKQINEIYKKLPSNRRVKVDKAITALENIQKRLRTNTYDASIGLPISIIDAGITVIKNSIKAGVNISDAIEIGINHIKAKYGKNWEKEDDFRKDMHDGFNTEGIDAKERTAKEKTKIKGIKETVKQALIDAGFYREIKTKNGINKVLDWVKLVGRDASVEGLKKNVEEQLKKQGFDDAKIAEISNELEIEYKRLAKDILDKATADLERRNLIKPSPNRKSDNQRLVDLYNEGLFGDNIKKYENAVNRILGFSDIDNANYDKIKQKLFALSELYKAKNNGKKISEQSINAVSNELNHAISNIMAVSSFVQAPKYSKLASLSLEFGVLAQKALLGGIKTLAENVVSGDYAASANRINTDSYMTPELKKQTKANVKAVKNDIVENAGLYYGDVTTSLVTHSIIEDLINQKITSKAGHIIMSAITLRRWLDAKDSAIKVRLTDALFIKNAVDILTNKTNPNGAMSKEDAVQFVSKALTGESFDIALISAKNIIDDVNSKQEVKQLKDNKEAIHRFAMELVRENLMSGKRMSMSEIEASFKGAYKSAGRSIGHEANNIMSKQVNMGNAYLSSELNKAISNKDYPKATMLTVQSLIMRAIVQPFAGGGANWTVIGAEKGVPVIGYASTAYNYVSKKPLELNSVTGINNLQESLFRENSFKESAVRNIIGTGMAVVAYAAMMGYKDDDDETNAKKLNDWMNKKENEWVRPYFNKLSPTAFSFIVAMEDENLGRYLAQLFGNSGDSFDNSYQVIKSFDSEKEGATAGAVGKLVGQPFSSPLAWKPIKDAVEIYKGLIGIVPKKKSYKVNGFMNGYLQGGLLEQLGLRPDLKNDFDSPEAKFKEKQNDRKEKGDVPVEEKAKIKANNSAVRIRSIVKELENELKSAESNTPYYNSKGKLIVFTPQKIKNIKNSIRREKLSLEKKIKKAGDLYKEPEE